MLLNRGVFGSNKPPFAKLIRGMFTHAGESGAVRQTGLTSPVSSASRNRLRLRNCRPPQYAASYWLKYQPQVGRRWAPSPMFACAPHRSKSMLRTKLGVVLTIVLMLGNPLGGGSDPEGNCIDSDAPLTEMVARVTG